MVDCSAEAGNARGAADLTSGSGSVVAALIAACDAGEKKGASNGNALARTIAGWAASRISRSSCCSASIASTCPAWSAAP